MSTTTSTNEAIELIDIDGELLPVEASPKKRASPFEHDEKYIREYVQNPHLGKTSAYQKATGNMTSYCKQRAFELHMRLAKEIDARLKERLQGTIGFGMNVLFDLANNSENDGVKAACASKLIELGMRVQPPELKKISQRSREEILLEIKQTKERIRKLGVSV